jgi:hypothetical protein
VTNSRPAYRRAAADCLALSGAMVEADAVAECEPDPDLAARVCRARLGYLTLDTVPIIPGAHAR